MLMLMLTAAEEVSENTEVAPEVFIPYLIIGWTLMAIPILMWLVSSLEIGGKSITIKSIWPLIGSEVVGFCFLMAAHYGWGTFFETCIGVAFVIAILAGAGADSCKEEKTN